MTFYFLYGKKIIKQLRFAPLRLCEKNLIKLLRKIKFLMRLNTLMVQKK